MSYANAANIAAAMSRSGPPAGAKAPPRASCRRNSSHTDHTDRRPLTRTAHSGSRSSSAGGLWIEPFDSPSRVVIDR